MSNCPEHVPSLSLTAATRTSLRAFHTHASNPGDMLDHEPSPQHYPFGNEPTVTMEQTDTPTSDAGQLLAPGTILCGTYRIGAVLGRGGMSQVLEAVDLRDNRTVAIKVCKRGLSGVHAHREGQFLCMLSHPGIVPIYDMGTDQGCDFLVLERLHGDSLRDRIRRPMSLRAALDILIGLCDALAAIHRAGVTHGDIKPSNIMLDADERPVLLDFGVARSRRHWGRIERMSGSPSYMAPEIIDCTARHRLGHLTDIYALGCLAYELIAQRAPFSGVSVKQILFAHLSCTPQRVSRFATVPAALEQLIAAMMDKVAARRPQSVEDIRARLQTIHDDLVESRGVCRTPRPARRPRRSPRRSGAAPTTPRRTSLDTADRQPRSQHFADCVRTTLAAATHMRIRARSPPRLARLRWL